MVTSQKQRNLYSSTSHVFHKFLCKKEKKVKRETKQYIHYFGNDLMYDVNVTLGTD